MVLTLSKQEISILAEYCLWSANSFDLAHSKILTFRDGWKEQYLEFSISESNKTSDWPNHLVYSIRNCAAFLKS